ncbi:MAG: pilin [bacterium]
MIFKRMISGNMIFKNKQRGLSRIETVFAVFFGVWAVVSTVPAIYNFTGRAEAIHADTLMKPVRVAVNKYLQTHGVCPPAGVGNLGIALGTEDNVESVVLEEGCVIKATYTEDTRHQIAGKTLVWYAGADTDGKVHWACGTAEPPSLGLNPRIPFAAGPEDNTANYTPWLPSRCHPPRLMDERKPALVVLLEKGSIQAE